MEVRIYAMTHKEYEFPKDGIYRPLQVGYACHHRNLGYETDATGDHISEKNPFYSELTGLYWVWKNVADADVIGICHYRRYLQNNAGKLFNREQILQVLSSYDVMTTKKVILDNSYLDGFSGKHNRQDLIVTGEVIKEKFPAYSDCFETMIRQNTTYFGNMMICKRELFAEYAEWLFSILFEVEKRIDTTDYNDYQKRVYGFISEILLMVYLKVKGCRVYECDVAVIGEKKETEETIRTIGELLREYKIEEAMQYFHKVYQKRPDVLMEASDTKGDLKLCVQLLASLHMESERMGSSYLEKENRPEELLKIIRQLNELAAQSHNGKRTEEMERYRKEKELPECFLETALRLRFAVFE